MTDTPAGDGNPPPPPPPPPGTPGYQPPGFGTPGWQPQPYGAGVPAPPPPGYGPPGYGPPGWQPANAAPAQPPAPVPPLEYHLILRGGRLGWWRNIVGSVSLVALMYVVAPFVVSIPFVIWFVANGRGVADQFEQMVDLENATPIGLAYLNLLLAAAIPITWLLIRSLHGLKPRWLSSVVPRLRWRYLLVCFGLAFVALFATLLVSALLPAQDAAGAEVTGHLNDFTSTTRDFLLVVLFLTPLQAAGEEYAFRGYLAQAFGGLFRSRIAAVIVPATLFALAHGLGQSAPIFFDRFAFGLVAGTLVILTGGLEAGIAMHVLNNWLAFGLALAFGDLSSSLNPTGGTWWSIPVTLTQSLVYLGLAWWVARAMGLATKADPAILEASRRRV
jgi:membrane protease YdiL (CAAX protease family)